MEFQSGDGAQLKPVNVASQKAPASSYVTFNNKELAKLYLHGHYK
jgi:hypothetical protein